MLTNPLIKDLPLCVFQEHFTLMGRLFVLVGVLPFDIFCKESSCFSLLHAHFDICHYLMILCHFDRMNDIMMFSLSIE